MRDNIEALCKRRLEKKGGKFMLPSNKALCGVDS